MARYHQPDRVVPLPVAWVLATIALAFGRQPAVVAQATAVEIRVESKSWVPGSAFDLERLRAQCSDAGIDLVPVRETHADRPTITVTYAEVQGIGFSMFGIGRPVGYGTEVTYALKLLVPPAKKPRLTIAVAAETPAGVEKEQFHQTAKDRFHAAPGFRFSCDAVAATLGSRTAQRRLLPWAITDSQGVAALDGSGFTPDSPLDRAFVATARRDFAGLRTLGPEAADPLLLLLQNSAVERDGIGLLPASTAANARVIAQAVTTLVALNDERTPDALAAFLSDYADARAEPEGPITPALEAVIKALGAVGTEFSLPLLEEWQQGDGRVAAAAREAVASVHKRVIF